MATATYRIGPSDFFSSGDLKADADTLDGQVQDLDAQVEGNEHVDHNWLDQWLRFQGLWAAFYYQEFGGTFTNFVTALNDANRDQLVSFENQFQALYTSSGLALANVVQPSKGAGDTHLPGLPSVGDLTGLIVAIVVLVIAWEVVK